MATRKKPGLGSDNMDLATKQRIWKAGGLSQPIEAKRKGGRIGGAKSRRH